MPVENIFQKIGCQLCRTFGGIQNCRPTQLLAHDNRWTIDERIHEHERLMPAILKMDKGNVNTLLAIKRFMSLEISA